MGRVLNFSSIIFDMFCYVDKWITEALPPPAKKITQSRLHPVITRHDPPGYPQAFQFRSGEAAGFVL
jgi:hypothetical protein